MITDVSGVAVGHWTDAAARTGCTVVRLPPDTIASGEIRGGAPATRDFGLLAPERTVGVVHAVVLTGGSVFGLASVDGVLGRLESEGVGLPLPAGPIPIVVGMGLYDLGVGDPSIRPGPAQGAAAAASATDGEFAVGAVGAGAGATVAKWDGPEHARSAGLGTASRREDDLIVGAVVAVNAAGWIDDGSVEPRPGALRLGNTTIGTVVTNARLDKVGCYVVAQGGHGGLARSITPAHTRRDGDAIVAAATGALAADVDVDLVRWLATEAVADAVRSVPLGAVGVEGEH